MAKLMLDDPLRSSVRDIWMDKNPDSRKADSAAGQHQTGSEDSDSFQLFDILYSFDQDPMVNMRLKIQSDFMPILQIMPKNWITVVYES